MAASWAAGPPPRKWQSQPTAAPTFLPFNGPKKIKEPLSYCYWAPRTPLKLGIKKARVEVRTVGGGGVWMVSFSHTARPPSPSERLAIGGSWDARLLVWEHGKRCDWPGVDGGRCTGKYIKLCANFVKDSWPRDVVWEGLCVYLVGLKLSD